MIKIQPFLATDSTQVKALLRHQNEPVPYEAFCDEDRVLNTGFTFWQHWLPAGWHLAPSVYVARESGVILGLISLDTTGKSRNCLRVNHLVVHPQHRGRGIGQELLRFALSFFGSQGINYFVSEVSDHNSRALSLLGSTGFRKITRVNYFQVPLDFEENPEILARAPGLFRLAEPQDKTKLHNLHQDILPGEMRRILDYCQDDYCVADMRADNLEKLAKVLHRKKCWYWLCEESEREVISCAARVLTHRPGDYHIEFMVHPGWLQTNMTVDIVEFVLSFMKRAGMEGMAVIKIYDFQSELLQVCKDVGLDSLGGFSLLAREHWLRAKRKKSITLEQVSLTNLGAPAINLPYWPYGSSPNN